MFSCQTSRRAYNRVDQVFFPRGFHHATTVPIRSRFPLDAPSRPCAADDLGRVVSNPKDVPEPRPDRKVGLFYFLWLDGDIPRDRNLPEGENGPYDVSKLETIDPAPAQNDALTGTDAQMHYWGEPLFGYYASSDPYVLRRHVRLIADAGVDTLIFDTTNAVTYENAYLALCDVILEALANGEPAPQVAFMTNTNATATVQKLWDEFYSHEKYRPVFFPWKGKPLLIANPDEVPEEIRDFFTIRDSYWPTETSFRTRDAWRWVDGYPQRYSWHDDEDRPDQLNVSRTLLRLRRGEPAARARRRAELCATVDARA